MGKNNRARRAAKAKARSRAQATSRERARRRDQADADDRSGHGAAGPSGATGHGGGEGHRQTNDIFGDSYRADPEGWTHDLLVDAGSFQHQEKRNRRYNSDLRTAVLRQLGRVPLDVLATAAERALLGRVEALWQGGWQPAELLRQARLNGSKAITARLMAQVVANDEQPPSTGGGSPRSRRWTSPPPTPNRVGSAAGLEARDWTLPTPVTR